MVRGHTKIPGGECHRHENGFRNEMTKKQTKPNFCNKWLFGMDAGSVQTNMVVLLHMHSAFPTKMGEQMIMTS